MVEDIDSIINEFQRCISKSTPETLNTTNLTGGQSCLESILVPPFPKIYHQFHQISFLQKFLFSVHPKTKNHISATAEFFLDIWTELNLIQLPFSAAEFLIKELNMKLYSINGGKGLQNSATIQLKNKKFSYNQQNSVGIYSKRKEFALNFIQSNKISLDNFSVHPIYQDFTKNEKNAIRYYLKKNSSVKDLPQKQKQQRSSKGRRKDKVFFSFLLVPIIAIEVAICLLSANFYLSLGVDYHLAYILSISVESFYMFSSALSDVRFQMLRTVILGYSIFTVGYSNLINDPTLSKNKELMNYQIQQEERSLKRQEDNLINLNHEKTDLIKTMQGYRERSYISRGINKVSPKIDKINKQRIDTFNTIKNIQHQLELLKTRQVKEESFTWATLIGLHLSTYAIIFGFILMQLCSSLYLRPCLNSLEKWVKGTTKSRRRRYATA